MRRQGVTTLASILVGLFLFPPLTLGRQDSYAYPSLIGPSQYSRADDASVLSTTTASCRRLTCRGPFIMKCVGRASDDFAAFVQRWPCEAKCAHRFSSWRLVFAHFSPRPRSCLPPLQPKSPLDTHLHTSHGQLRAVSRITSGVHAATKAFSSPSIVLPLAVVPPRGALSPAPTTSCRCRFEGASPLARQRRKAHARIHLAMGSRSRQTATPHVYVPILRVQAVSV